MRNRITGWLQAEPVPEDLGARVMADPRLAAKPGAALRGRLAFATAALVVLVVGGGLASILLRGAHPAGVVGQVLASPSATPSAPAASPTPASPAAASPAPTPSVTPAQTSPASLPKCRTADLAVVIGSTNGAAGTIYSIFNVSNRTSAACSLQGFFGLALLDAAGQQVGGTPRRDGSAISPTVVNLAPGASTAFTFHWSDVQSSPQPCPTAAQVLVTAPDQFDHLVVPARTAGGGRIAPCEPGGTGLTQVGPRS